MKLILTESEALLIKQKFNFGVLLGLNVKQRIKIGTEKILRKKGIVFSNNGKDELSNEYRALFSNWEKMQYSIVRPELNDKNHLQCLLSNEQVSIFFVRKKDIITIELFDFSEEKFDKMIASFAELSETDVTEPMFNFSMSLDEYEQFIVCSKQDQFAEWKKETGIDVTLLEKYVSRINTKGEARMLLVEDHVNDCGYMAKIVVDHDGIYAVKHITYKTRQKMVLLFGNTQYVVDSIYNF